MREVLDLFWQNDMEGELFWRVDNKKITFYAMCSDVFSWGTADCEEITERNFRELCFAIDDIRAIDKNSDLGLELFAARQRKMRPQGAAYPKDKTLWPLFDACGPKRVIDLFNPYKHPEDKDATD